jgi:uncharacterized protein YbcV (DUF1398 family)
MRYGGGILPSAMCLCDTSTHKHNMLNTQFLEYCSNEVYSNGVYVYFMKLNNRRRVLDIFTNIQFFKLRNYCKKLRILYVMYSW